VSNEQRHTTRTPLLFLLLVPVFSLPFYSLDRRSLLPAGMPFIAVTALMVFVPMIIALAFTYKERGWSGVRSVLASAVDARRVQPLFWLVPALLLLPTALYLAYLVSRLLGNDLGAPTPVWENAGTALAIFVLLLIPLAIAEEVGWMGYAADPLRERWGTLGASVIIGIVWAAWHWVPWYRSFGSFEWVFWQTVLDVLLRLLTFWLYNNTRGSIFIAAVFHASFNVGYGIFPDEGRSYDPFATVLVVGALTLLVLAIRGQRTFAGY
jgi:membrane protease YdiL (CAAX protease family)